jgi:hypothetical protein
VLKRATLLLAVLLTSPGAQASLSGLSPPGPQEPSEGALFGAWVQPLTGWSRSDVEAAIEAFEGRLGRSLGIDHHFYPRGSPYPTWREPWDISNGRVPMITAGAVSTKKVNSGALDAALHARAAGVRDLGHPIFLRWFAEMDGDFQRRLTRSPSSYIRAWRRARWIFAREGAWNAVWVWCPTAYGFETGEAERYYPGDMYVDWICADGYNWAPARPGANWRGLREIYDPFYDFGMARGKPMMIGEYGCLERHPGEKAAWIADAQAVLKEAFPNIGAVVYFNSKGDPGYDWRVETSDSALQAFQAMGADPYFNPSRESLGQVDVHRFDAVLADTEAPEVHFVGRPRLRAGHPASLRWVSFEPNADFVRLRYARRGHGPKVIRGHSEDDGRFRWRVPLELRGKRIRILIAATDLAGNGGSARSRWVQVR